MKSLSKKALAVKPSKTLEINAMANKLKADGIDVISFGAGEPDFDTPDNIKKTAINAINDGFTKYTQTQGIETLRAEICKKLERDNNLTYLPSQIVVSNGAKQSLHNAFAALLNEGDEVIVPAPFWLSYSETISLCGGVPIIAMTEESKNFEITKKLLEDNLSEKTKCIIVNSPNNPTGVVYSLEALKIVGDFAVENDLYIISDEIYEMLIFDDNIKHHSIAAISQEIFERTIVVNGFSKSYSMTGWRIGYTASNETLAKLMSNVQGHESSNINSMSQKAAIEALSGDQGTIEQMRLEFKKRRDYIFQRVSDMKLITATRPTGAFYIFINIEKLIGKKVGDATIKNATDLAKLLLLNANVAVVPCEDFGSENHIRLSYPISIDTIKNGMDRIEGFINSL